MILMLHNSWLISPLSDILVRFYSLMQYTVLLRWPNLIVRQFSHSKLNLHGILKLFLIENCYHLAYKYFKNIFLWFYYQFPLLKYLIFLSPFDQKYKNSQTKYLKYLSCDEQNVIKIQLNWIIDDMHAI